MIPANEHRRSLVLVRNALIVMGCLAFAAQCVLDASRENLLSNLLCLAAFVPTCLMVFRLRNACDGAAFTAAVVFLNVFGNSLLPMLGTLLEGHLLTHTLQVPLETFTHRWLFALTLLAAHFCAGSALLRKARAALGRLTDVLHVRSLVSPRGLWALGGIGLLASFLKPFLVPGSVPVKVLDGFGFLSFAPFVLLVPPYWCLRGGPSRLILLGLLYGVHVAVAIAANSRMGFVGPIATVASAWLVTFLAGHTAVDGRTVRRGAVLAVIGLAALGQLRDLSTALLIERAYRSERPALEQALATWNRFLNKEALAAYDLERDELEGESAEDSWQENYVRNPFLGRFIQVKFDDTLFVRLKEYTAEDIVTLKSVSYGKVLAQIPDPILRGLRFDVDKLFLNSFSTGDLMEVLSGRGFLGGFRTGSVLAHAYALFGWIYPALLFGMVTTFFFLAQAVAIPDARVVSLGLRATTFALVYGFPFFLSFSLDGLDSLAGMLVRGIWQVLLLYGFSVTAVSMVVPGARLRGNLRQEGCSKVPLQPARVPTEGGL